MTDVCYRTSAAIEADNTLTSVEPYTSFRPKRETTLPCSSFRPLIAPAIIPIDEKLAKETRKIEIMPSARGESVEKKVYVPFELVTPANLKDYQAKN